MLLRKVIFFILFWVCRFDLDYVRDWCIVLFLNVIKWGFVVELIIWYMFILRYGIERDGVLIIIVIKSCLRILRDNYLENWYKEGYYL